jgi:uncharacterized protein (TIGR00730 family)
MSEFNLNNVSSELEQTKCLDGIGKIISIFGSAREKPSSKYYPLCYDTAKILAKNNFYIMTGGGGGIMEIANKAGFEHNLSIGLNIKLPQEQKPNNYQNINLTFSHFFTRKAVFNSKSDGFIAFPGGFGTLDEVHTLLTLIQTEKLHRRPIVLMDTKFWHGWFEWIDSNLNDTGFISKQDLSDVLITSSHDEAYEFIKKF